MNWELYIGIFIGSLLAHICVDIVEYFINKNKGE
mgnify:CR=1 FL=1